MSRCSLALSGRSDIFGLSAFFAAERLGFLPAGPFPSVQTSLKRSPVKPCLSTRALNSPSFGLPVRSTQ